MHKPPRDPVPPDPEKAKPRGNASKGGRAVAAAYETRSSTRNRGASKADEPEGQPTTGGGQNPEADLT